MTRARLTSLKKPAEFKRCFNQGKRVHQPPFSLVFFESGVDRPRLGLAISKRKAARAVERNRVKRQLREDFRLRQTKLPKLDCVVYLNARTDQRSNRELRLAIGTLWQKVVRKCAD